MLACYNAGREASCRDGDVAMLAHACLGVLQAYTVNRYVRERALVPRWCSCWWRRSHQRGGDGNEVSDPIPHVEIVIVDYDPRWPVRYAEERARVMAVLADLVESIEHIGSTS